MIQIVGTRRRVFIKFTDCTFVHEILHTTNGTNDYKHTTGEISPVRLKIAGMGTFLIRLGNLPPEISGWAICSVLLPYGVTKSMHDETGLKTIVKRLLTEYGLLRWHSINISQKCIVTEYRSLASYEGLPQTCYGCCEIDHMYQVCPKRRSVKPLVTENVGLLHGRCPSLSDTWIQDQ
jgi:hypothetical protein